MAWELVRYHVRGHRAVFALLLGLVIAVGAIHVYRSYLFPGQAARTTTSITPPRTGFAGLVGGDDADGNTLSTFAIILMVVSAAWPSLVLVGS